MYKADHTCLSVSDIDAERSFYETALGFRTVDERRPNEYVRMIFLEDTAKSYRLQLVSGKGPARPDFGHLAVVCDNFDESYTSHMSMGCVKSGIIVQKERRSYFIADPEGYETEILNR